MKRKVDIVIKSLPLLLDDKMKEEGAIKISWSMNDILKEIKTIDDLELFADVLEQCKMFATKHNMPGFIKVCSIWNDRAVAILNELTRANMQKNMADNAGPFQDVKHFLDETRAVLYNDKSLNSDDVEAIWSKLDGLENILLSTGERELSKSQIDYFMNEIRLQKERIEGFYSLTDDIMTR